MNKLFLVFNIVKFRFKGVSFGKGLRVRGGVDLILRTDAKITVGNNFSLISGKMYNSIGRNIKSCLRADDKAAIKIGDNVGMSNVCVWSKTRIEIGNNVKVGADCIIVDSDMHSLNYIERRSPDQDVSNAKKIPIKIDDDVFIGTRSIICKGVHIGERSIIGAGSVVVSSVPADEIWAGNPAKFVKKLTAE